MPRRFIVHPGDRFGRLTVLRDADHGEKHPHVECRCECGTVKIVDRYHLKTGKTRSCGCLNRETSTKHGLWNSPTYHSWLSMKQRCLQPNCPAYKYYGARGITICPEWIGSFGAFLKDMGPRPEGKMSLDRINNEGNYEPRNCRWATTFEQADNTRATVHIDIGGEKINLREAARRAGVDPMTISHRLRAGWTPEQILSLKNQYFRRKPANSDSTAIIPPGKAHILEIGGERITRSEIRRRTGLTKAGVQARIKAGWPLERLLDPPLPHGQRLGNKLPSK